MNIEISKSNKTDKRFKAVIDGKKTIHFGDSNYSDFTKHKDPERTDNYISRHKNNENWGKLVLTLPVFTVNMCFGTSQP